MTLRLTPANDDLQHLYQRDLRRPHRPQRSPFPFVEKNYSSAQVDFCWVYVTTCIHTSYHLAHDKIHTSFIILKNALVQKSLDSLPTFPASHFLWKFQAGRNIRRRQIKSKRSLGSHGIISASITDTLFSSRRPYLCIDIYTSWFQMSFATATRTTSTPLRATGSSARAPSATAAPPGPTAARTAQSWQRSTRESPTRPTAPSGSFSHASKHAGLVSVAYQFQRFGSSNHILY